MPRPRRRGVAGSVSFAWVLALAAPALAQPMELVLTNNVPPGKKPSILLTAKEPIKLVTLDIERLEDRKAFKLNAGPLTVGERAELAIGDGKAGTARWKGKLVVVAASGEVANDVTFESHTIAGAGAPRLVYDRGHLDLERGRLEFQVSQPAEKAELVVVGEDGKAIASVEKSLAGQRPGAWLPIEWKPTAAPVLRLELKVSTIAGGAVHAKLVPWSVAIAHEEVVFPSGQATIAESETKKLDASYQKIVDAVDKVRKHEPQLDVRVYVAGHTDTVGGADDNRKLSQARAKAIAAWFRDRGLPMPMYYAGFGEDQPRVKTADNTDEARNRRADYVVGVEEPASGRGRYAPLK
jgi:outer membrane protein OmpA-like peptidoglycan-associated protein